MDDQHVGWLRSRLRGKLHSTMAALLFGMGILSLTVALVTDAYGWVYGVVGPVFFWPHSPLHYKPPAPDAEMLVTLTL